MSNSSIWPIDRAFSCATTPSQSGHGSDCNEGVPPHSPKLQHYWSLTFRLFNVISRTLVWGGVTPLQRYSGCILQQLNVIPNHSKFVKTSYLVAISMIKEPVYKYKSKSFKIYQTDLQNPDRYYNTTSEWTWSNGNKRAIPHFLEMQPHHFFCQEVQFAYSQFWESGTRQ